MTVAARPDEPLEHAFLLVRADAWSVVTYPEPHGTVLDEGADRDLAALLGVLDRVLRELHQRLGDALPVGGHDAGADVLDHPLAWAECPSLVVDLGRELRHVHLRQL